jgi:hypothetical protein
VLQRVQKEPDVVFMESRYHVIAAKNANDRTINAGPRLQSERMLQQHISLGLKT